MHRKQTERADSYEVLARHYDAAYAAMPDRGDVGFYVELAKRSGGPVLEIACGTGRVLLAIARAGIAIEGVDNSAAMLGLLKANLAREPREVRERVTLHEGDMRNFRLAKKFPLAMMPFRPMQHMYELRDQVDALTTAAAHLRDDGRLAFDLFYPKFETMAAGIGEEVFDSEWMEAPGRRVRRFFRKESFDKIQQVFTGSFIFRTYEGEKLVREESDPLKMCYYTYMQIRAVLELAALDVEEEYGSFAKTAMDNAATEMIFVAKRRKP
ncbi:MAG TPA: class I SAM-dependent methyltransferase [Candidatus Limnocylindrales bacterium]|nr:class I SAM-dependent methyltransferase [Candidatus Limnocylindrales bacterium]